MADAGGGHPDEDREVAALIAQGMGGWMASPAELQAANMAMAGEPVQHESAAAANPQTWKKWSGRSEGDGTYRFGDFTRGLVKGVSDNVAQSIRDGMHTAANARLQVKETVERHARDRIQQHLNKEREEEDDAASPSPPQKEGAGDDQLDFAFTERWWYTACQAAHRTHDRSSDPQGERAHKGVLEVTFVDADFGGAPLCQLSVESSKGYFHSGGLSPLRRVSGTEDEEPAESAASFLFQEVAGCDLRVNVFDGSCMSFKSGFEAKALVGGAFLPLVLIMERGALSREVVKGAEGSKTAFVYSYQFQLQLLPLELLRDKRKLRSASVSKAARPKRDNGTVTLGVRLVLHCAEPEFAMPLGVQLTEPFLGYPREKAAFENVIEPMTFLKEAADSVDRLTKAFFFDSKEWVVGRVRDDPAAQAVLQTWWLCVALLAPLWAWPPLFVAVLPVLSWGVCSSSQALLKWPLGTEPPALFQDIEATHNQEGDLPEKSVSEKWSAGLQDAAKARMDLQNFFLQLSMVASCAEKVKFLLAVGDRMDSVICLLVALLASLVLSGALVLFGVFCERGGGRALVWLAGTYLLLPSVARVPLDDMVQQIEREMKKRKKLNAIQKRLKAFWERVPDGVEAAHLELCRGGVLIGKR